ncbi:hypothetical protein ACFQ61_31525, partial [Streptomyces sp. NPDC056500]
MPMPLAAQMMRLAPDAGDPLYVETFLRCKVAEHSEGRHYDLVWQLDDARQGEMWAAWTDGRAPETVLLARRSTPSSRPGGRASRVTGRGRTTRVRAQRTAPGVRFIR